MNKLELGKKYVLIHKLKSTENHVFVAEVVLCEEKLKEFCKLVTFNS